MIVYVDMDGVLCAYSEAYVEACRRAPEIDYPQSVPGFFTSLKPIPGGVDAVNELRQLFDVYILTAPSTRNPHSYTEKRLWIEEHFDYEFTKKLIISPNKGLLKGDYLIDDYASGRGQDSFEGTLLHFGTEAYADWRAVMRYLLSVAPPH